MYAIEAVSDVTKEDRSLKDISYLNNAILNVLLNDFAIFL